MEYITLQELQQIYEVSESTARRTYKAIRDKEPRLFQGKEVIKKTPITNGKYKILLLKSLIDSKLNKSSQSPSQVTSQSDQSIQKAMELLEQQLKEKDKLLHEQSQQINNFLELEIRVIDQYRAMERKLEDKNTEIRHLQAIAQDRQRLLEQYTSEKSNSEDSTPSTTINVDNVEDVKFSEESEIPNSINPESEKSFLNFDITP